MTVEKKDKPILVTRSSMPDLEDYIEEIRSIWDSHWLTNMGPKHEELKKKLVSLLDTPYLELFTNGHMALELSLNALNLKGEVITTPFTFVSTTNAIVRNGLKPVFCDIKPDDYTMDPAKLEALITEDTCAIMPVHVYGNICDVEAIAEIARKYHLKVIYDAAHAFGETYNGRGVCSFGDVSCFSFHATKVFNTIEGGAASFHDESMGIRLDQLRNFGYSEHDDVHCIGANAKMNEFCAAMGLCNLRNLDRAIAKRKAVCERYRKNLSDIPGLVLNVIQKNVTSNYSYFPVRIKEAEFGINRDQLVDRLAEYNIFARKYFYPAVNALEAYKDKYKAEDTPIALQISQEILTLPLYEELSLTDVDDICAVIKSVQN